GTVIDWAAVQAGRGLRRVSLPTYPFERRRHWIDATVEAETPAAEAVAAPMARDEPPRSSEVPPPPAGQARRPHLLSPIPPVFADLSGLSPCGIEPAPPFLDT